MGVWIEIPLIRLSINRFNVTPCVGVWIEINRRLYLFGGSPVTPCVGVWIEIVFNTGGSGEEITSLPAWECGLKL